VVIEFSCSCEAQTNIIHAIQCIPLSQIEGIKLLFVCIDSSDARRLVMENYEGFEIIVISEFVIPRNWKTEDEWSKKYFNYVVLHEVAHALLKHKSPRNLTVEQNNEQENEADELAMSWFNEYLTSKEMELYSDTALKEAQIKVQKDRKKYLIN
jgi:hypothetical protein